MSHHLDSPLARQDIRLDICDLYVFRGETGTVFIMDVCHSVAGQETGDFHPEGLYEFKIDLDGDAAEDLTYRFTFAERTESGTQDWTLRRLTGAEAGDPDASGTVIAQGGTDQAVTTEAGLRVWTGKAGDPFWIEPGVLAAVGKAFKDGTRIDLSTWDPAAATNRFAGQTMYAIVLEVPDADLSSQTGPEARIGVWGLTTMATDAGGWRPVNRAGLPMIHPLFAQFDEQLGDRLNGGSPGEDRHDHGRTITDMVVGVVRAYGTAADPGAYSLTDNAPDVMFSFASNTPVSIGITKESVTAKPSQTFPYVPAVA